MVNSAKERQLSDASLKRLYFMDSRRCNNNCVFCSSQFETGRGRFSLKRPRQREFASLADARKLAARFPPETPVIFSGGEPTLNPALPAIIALFCGRGFKDIRLTTNGRLLSYMPYCRVLAGSGLREVMVSIHGSCPRVHDAITNSPGSFEQSLAGILNMLKLCGEYPRLSVCCNLTVIRQNINDLADVARLFKGKGLRNLVFHGLIPAPKAGFAWEEISVPYSSIAREYKKAARLWGSGKDALRLEGMPFCVKPVLGYDTLKSSKLVGYSGSVRRDRGKRDWESREKRAECRACAFNGCCEGVYSRYIKTYGWNEFRPLRKA